MSLATWGGEADRERLVGKGSEERDGGVGVWGEGELWCCDPGDAGYQID